MGRTTVRGPMVLAMVAMLLYLVGHNPPALWVNAAAKAELWPRILTYLAKL